MTKLIVAFRNFTKAPKINFKIRFRFKFCFKLLRISDDKCQVIFSMCTPCMHKSEGEGDIFYLILNHNSRMWKLFSITLRPFLPQLSTE
jgi:hypothetical protein